MFVLRYQRALLSSMTILVHARLIRFVAPLFLCLAALLSCPAPTAAEPKRVLLLHASSGANLLYATQIRAELSNQSPEPLEIFNASLITGRPTDEAAGDRYRDYIRAIFPKQKLDLVVAV